jgi:hypothetical protein
MATYPKGPNEITSGMRYFARMLDKIRLHACGDLHEDYHKNLGATRGADGALCNFLRINYVDLCERVKQGGSDEEILEWCFEKGRRPNEGDIFLWNGFVSKIGFRDFATPTLARMKREHGISGRADIATMPDMMDFEEGRRS